MKKKCINCNNFSVFYTKIEPVYYQTRCGRCWANKAITGSNETCGKWTENPANKKSKRKKIISELNEVIANLTIIKAKFDK